MVHKNREKIGAVVLALFVAMATVQGAEERFLPILKACKTLVSAEGRPKMSAFDHVIEGAQHKTLDELGKAATLEADKNLYEWVCLAVANDVPNRKFVGYESSRATDCLCAFLQKHAQSNAVIQDALCSWLDYTPDIEERESRIDRNPAGYCLAALRILHASRAISVVERCALIRRIGYSDLSLVVAEEMLREVIVKSDAEGRQKEFCSVIACIKFLLLQDPEEVKTFEESSLFRLLEHVSEYYPQLAQQADKNMPHICK